MQLLIGILLIAYVMGILPILLGIAWNRVFRVQRYGIADVYAKGYLLLFAGFAIEAILFIRMGKNLPFFTKHWMLTALIVGIVSLTLGVRKFPEFFRGLKKAFREVVSHRVGVVFLALAVGLLIFSVMFVKPLPDASVEYAIAAVDSDHMYYYHPYTMASHGEFEAGKRIAPVEMFFATLAVQTKLSPATIMKIIAPIFLIPLFYAVCWEIGRKLYRNEGEGQCRKVCYFTLAAMALVTIPIYSGNEYLGFAVYRNSWNGLTLLNCVVLPYTIVWCFGILQHIKAHKVAAQDIILLPVLAAAAQLMQARGAIYVAVMIGIWMVIGIIERICRHGVHD